MQIHIQYIFFVNQVVGVWSKQSKKTQLTYTCYQAYILEANKSHHTLGINITYLASDINGAINIVY